jgi:excisionase family DNA binding protein
MSTPNDRFLTIKEIAASLGAEYWQVQRAVKRGDIPSYTPFNSRKLLRLSEVIAAIEAKRFTVSS